jgi:hypothetical protein
MYSIERKWSPSTNAEVVNAADVRMRHLACDADFVAEAREGTLTQMGRIEELEGDSLIEDQIVSAIDLAHPAAAEEPEHAIAPGEHGAGRKAALLGRGTG